MTTKILFLCTGNSCRSQFAEGLTNFYGRGKVRAFSAGTKPTSVSPYTIKTMKEIGIDISNQKSKNVSEFKGQEFDYVITLCESARDACPVFPGKAVKLHWDITDPASARGTEEEKLEVFRKARNLIKGKVLELIAEAKAEVKSNNGFTLIELMVVIVILGILAAVIAPRIPGFVERAKESKTKGNLANLRSALNLYYASNDGKYPVTTALSNLLAPKYMKEIPASEMLPSHAPSTAVTGDTGASSITAGDDGGWVYNYNNASLAWGDILPNCNAHTNKNGEFWSSY